MGNSCWAERDKNSSREVNRLTEIEEQAPEAAKKPNLVKAGATEFRLRECLECMASLNVISDGSGKNCDSC